MTPDKHGSENVIQNSAPPPSNQLRLGISVSSRKPMEEITVKLLLTHSVWVVEFELPSERQT